MTHCGAYDPISEDDPGWLSPPDGRPWPPDGATCGDCGLYNGLLEQCCVDGCPMSPSCRACEDYE